MINITAQNDQKILAELRKPIEELVSCYYPESPDLERFRLKQLAWQALDVLARTNEIASLKSNRDIQRLINNVKELGASEKFIEESLDLAVTIYRQIQLEYPGLLERYRG